MKPVILLSCLVLVALCGCTKQSAIPLSTFQATDLPSNAGSYWVYHYTNHDDFGTVDDTIIIKIKYVETSGPSKKLHFVITDSYNFVIDSAIGYLSNDSFAYYSVTPNDFLGSFKLIFPFSENQKWQSTDTRDTLHVITYSDNLAISTFRFSKVFDLYSVYRGSDAQRVNDLMIAKNVGVIQKNRKDNENAIGSVNLNQAFTLISYSIK